jgi:hypothetical protein
MDVMYAGFAGAKTRHAPYLAPCKQRRHVGKKPLFVFIYTVKCLCILDSVSQSEVALHSAITDLSARVRF